MRNQTTAMRCRSSSWNCGACHIGIRSNSKIRVSPNRQRTHLHTGLGKYCSMNRWNWSQWECCTRSPPPLPWPFCFSSTSETNSQLTSKDLQILMSKTLCFSMSLSKAFRSILLSFHYKKYKNRSKTSWKPPARNKSRVSWINLSVHSMSSRSSSWAYSDSIWWRFMSRRAGTRRAMIGRKKMMVCIHSHSSEEHWSRSLSTCSTLSCDMRSWYSHPNFLLSSETNSGKTIPTKREKG